MGFGLPAACWMSMDSAWCALMSFANTWRRIGRMSESSPLAGESQVSLSAKHSA